MVTGNWETGKYGNGAGRQVSVVTGSWETGKYGDWELGDRYVW